MPESRSHKVYNTRFNAEVEFSIFVVVVINFLS